MTALGRMERDAGAPIRGGNLRLPASEWWTTRRFVPLMMALATLPLLRPAMPPLVDLPGHLGRFHVMLGGDATTLGHWYRFTWHLVGNLGLDVLVYALAPLMGLEPAAKAVVIAIPALTVLGILWTAREVHGRVPPTALWALPFAYSFPFQFGFVNFCLAMALVLNAFAAWLALGRLDKQGLRACLFVPGAVVIWLCHMVGWGVLGIVVFAAELTLAQRRTRSWPRALVPAALHCLPLALPLVMQVAWRSASGGDTFNWAQFGFKASWLAMVLRDRWMWFDVPTTAAVFMLLYRGVREPGFGFARSLTIAAALLFGVFLVLPETVYGSTYADMRLAPYLVVLLVVALDPVGLTARQKRALALGGLALWGVRLAGQTASYWLYDQSYRRELAALDHIPRGSRVVAFVGRTCGDPWQKTRLEHLPAFAMVRRGAFANDQWQMAGAPLLAVTSPGGSDFATDPSQQVLLHPCKTDPAVRTIAASLAMLPRERFDYLWLIAPPPFDPRLLAGTQRVWSAGTSAVYRIKRGAASTTTVAGRSPAS